MRITVLSGGVGGARFTRGLLATLAQRGESPDVQVIANTGDDITMHGLRICPDIDTILYTLGGGADEDRGWGLTDEGYRVQEGLAAYGAEPGWFTLGDRDFATHIARTQWLTEGASLTEVTGRLAARWGLPEKGVTLRPMSDVPVETHAVIDGPQGEEALHFQEWWVRGGAQPTPSRFIVAGLDRASAAPGVLDAIRTADLVLLPPSNPVVSIGIILGVPGVRDALRGTSAPVVGVSPIIAGRPVRGHADTCLDAIGVPSTAAGVAGLYRDFLDGWLVDPADAAPAPTRQGPTVRAHHRDLLMDGADGEADLAAAALDLARDVRR